MTLMNLLFITRYSSSACYVPDTLLSAENMSMDKIDLTNCLHGVYIISEG